MEKDFIFITVNYEIACKFKVNEKNVQHMKIKEIHAEVVGEKNHYSST